MPHRSDAAPHRTWRDPGRHRWAGISRHGLRAGQRPAHHHPERPGAAAGQEATHRLPSPIRSRSVVMLQCVGPWDEEGDETDFYCSRICCSWQPRTRCASRSRIQSAQVFVLYNRDIRTYGFQEALYTQAREAGVVFLRYQEGSQPQVSTQRPAADHRPRRGAWASRWPSIPICWSSPQAIVPAEGSRELAETAQVLLHPGGLLPGGPRQAPAGGLSGRGHLSGRYGPLSQAAGRDHRPGGGSGRPRGQHPVQGPAGSWRRRGRGGPGQVHRPV